MYDGVHDRTGVARIGNLGGIPEPSSVPPSGGRCRGSRGTVENVRAETGGSRGKLDVAPIKGIERVVKQRPVRGGDRNALVPASLFQADVEVGGDLKVFVHFWKQVS